MNEKTQRQPENWREARRLRAWELAKNGWKQKDIAEGLGVSEGAVSQWLKHARLRYKADIIGSCIDRVHLGQCL